MGRANRFHVFLSHSSTETDREAVHALRTFLTRRKFEVYLAEFDIQPGKRIYDKIEARLGECHAVVVIITPNSSRSPWVLFELGMASLSKKPIIPIVQIGSEVPRPLAGIEYVAFDPDNLGPACEAVVRFLGVLRDRWRTGQMYKDLVTVGGFLVGLKVLDYLDKRAKGP